MTAFIVRRLLHGVLAIVILTVVVFVLSRITGDPLNQLLPDEASPEMRADLERQLGLDGSLLEQLMTYLGGLVRGDLGTSIHFNRPVMELFLDRYPNSLRLIIPAFVLAFFIGVPMGVLAATSRFKIVRRANDTFGVLGMAAPPFWIGIILILFFSVALGVLPSSRMGGISHYVLPVLSLALLVAAGLMRLIRSSMLEALGSEYIKMARLEGLSERSVIWRHALRNSLGAGIAYMGVYFALLAGGSIVIEKVFAWPGVGQLLYRGILARDYPLVQGLLILLAIFILFIGIAVDILRAFLDPRIKLAGGSSGTRR